MWDFNSAKAHFSKVFKAALDGKPQIIARNGEEAVVVLERSQYESMTAAPETLVESLLRPPFRGSQLEIQRVHERYVPRVNFEDEPD